LGLRSFPINQEGKSEREREREEESFPSLSALPSSIVERGELHQTKRERGRERIERTFPRLLWRSAGLVTDLRGHPPLSFVLLTSSSLRLPPSLLLSREKGQREGERERGTAKRRRDEEEREKGVVEEVVEELLPLLT
jgi:hypothetical protein